MAPQTGHPTEADPVDVLEVGSPIPRRFGRRLVATSSVMLVVVLAVVGGAGLRDHLQTVSEQRVNRAIELLQTDSNSRVRQQITEGVFGGLRTDPGQCVALLDSTLLSSTLLDSTPGAPAQERRRELSFPRSTSAGQVELGIIEYPTPRVARTAMRSLRQLTTECGLIAVLPRQEGDGGVRLNLEAVDMSWWAWIDANRASYQLRSQDTWAFPDTSVLVRRFGSVVVLGSSPLEPETAMSATVDRLISHLQ